MGTSIRSDLQAELAALRASETQNLAQLKEEAKEHRALTGSNFEHVQKQIRGLPLMSADDLKNIKELSETLLAIQVG
jgi:hypothetical protein